MLNLKAGNCQKQSQLFSVHLNQLYMHDTGALQRVRHSVSAWVKLDLCLFRFVEQLLQLVHIRVLPHLQTNERRNKWAKFIICPSWSFWLREGVGGNWVMGWRGGLAPSFGIQGPPLRSSRADRVIPMNSGDPPPPSQSLDFSPCTCPAGSVQQEFCWLVQRQSNQLVRWLSKGRPNVV